MKARIGAGFMIWLAAVVSVAGIAWLAIGTAGKQVTAAPIAAPLPTEFPPTPSHTRTSVPTTNTIGDDENRPATSPGRTATRTTAPVAPTSSGSSGGISRQNHSRPRFTPVTSTYSTPAGRLRVRCEGQEITLDGGYAQPAPGWGVSVQSGGPDKIQVTFDTGKSAPVTVVADCGQGRPHFYEMSTPRSVPTTSGGFGFRAQSAPTSPSTPTAPATTTPGCAVPPSPINDVSATATPTATVTPTATPVTTEPATQPACPEIEVTTTVTPTATVSPESWSQREWAQRSRH